MGLKRRGWLQETLSKACTEEQKNPVSCHRLEGPLPSHTESRATFPPRRVEMLPHARGQALCLQHLHRPQRPGLVARRLSSVSVAETRPGSVHGRTRPQPQHACGPGRCTLTPPSPCSADAQECVCGGPGGPGNAFLNKHVVSVVIAVITRDLKTCQNV